MTKYRVKGQLDYIQGYLRTGYLYLDLTKEELENFKELSQEEQIELLEEGELEVTDFVVNDRGDIYLVDIPEGVSHD